LPFVVSADAWHVPGGEPGEITWELWLLQYGFDSLTMDLVAEGAAPNLASAKRRSIMTITEDGARRTLPETNLSVDRRRSRFTLVIAAIVALVVGFIAGWAIRGDSTDESTAGTEVPAEVSALIDEWYAANERADGSVLDLYLPSGYHLYGDDRFDYSEIPDHLSGLAGMEHEWITEPILITADDDGSYVVVRGLRNVYEARGWDDSSALAFEIETTDDGSLKLAQTVWIYRQIRTG
jgi:hypothetical protein